MKLASTISLSILIFAATVSAQPPAMDPTQEKLDAALDAYHASVDEAAKQLLTSLDAARDAAQRRGNLQELESINAEIKAFETDRTLPKSVSPVVFERTTQRVARIEIAYENAIRDYTRDNKIPLAKQFQDELADIKKTGSLVVDPFKKHPVWVSTNPKMKLTISRRVGNTFQGRFLIGDTIDRLVSGTIDSKTLQWKSADVVVQAGRGPGGDNSGTVVKDGDEYKLEMEWRDGDGNGGKFVLHPDKS